MRCEHCGTEAADNQAFCIGCGRPLAATAPAQPAAGPLSPPPAALPHMPPPPPPPTPVRAPQEPKKRRGCFTGCLVVLLVFLLLVALLAAVVFRLPERVGLFPSDAERLLAGMPDAAAAAALEEEFAADGQDPAGMETYVLPVDDTDEVIAYVVLDESQGYSHTAVEVSNPVKDAFITTARSEAARGAGVTRVAVEYKDENAASLFVMTAPVDAILDHADGRITEEEFFARTAGEGNLFEIVRIQLGWTESLR